jgi:hypothetical protein
LTTQHNTSTATKQTVTNTKMLASTIQFSTNHQPPPHTTHHTRSTTHTQTRQVWAASSNPSQQTPPPAGSPAENGGACFLRTPTGCPRRPDQCSPKRTHPHTPTRGMVRCSRAP